MGSLRAEYERDVACALAGVPTLPALTEADIAPLPPPVRQYLRMSGAVGQPRIANFRVRLHGRIRSGVDSRWMPLVAEQHNVIQARQRFFYLTSAKFGLPVQGYHRYSETTALMHIKLAGLVTVAHVTGAQLFQSETVTLLNDICLFAPAALVDPALVWEEADVRTARVSFTNAGVTVRAELTFNAAGELTDFVSDDRYQATPDGRRATRRRWSTPVKAYRRFGAAHLIAVGEGRWHTPEGSFAYVELEVDEVSANVIAE